MTKEEFLIQYVLIRISNPNITSGPNIGGIIDDAEYAWNEIQQRK